LSEALAVSDRIATYFSAGAMKALFIRPLFKAWLTVVHLVQVNEEAEHLVSLPAEDAFLMILYLVDVDHRDIAPDGSLAPWKTFPKGSICLISLRHGSVISLRGRLEALVFHIPSSHFAELTDEAGEPRVIDLATCRGTDDQVIRNISGALMPMFDMPDEVRDRLLPHIGLALNAHLAHRYGRSPAQWLPATGRLSAMQEKRIKTYIAANLSANLTVDQIADATGFSVDELSLGFFNTTGQSVADWLSSYRVTRAQSRLSKTSDPVTQVAATCGFTDEDTFIEIFSKAVGVSPAEWRSQNRY
jgi:AraC-like DNA-binding protein